MKEAELVLIAHQRHKGGCLCGWNELGKSFAGHQIAMLEEAGLIKERDVEELSYEEIVKAVRDRIDDEHVPHTLQDKFGLPKYYVSERWNDALERGYITVMPLSVTPKGLALLNAE